MAQASGTSRESESRDVARSSQEGQLSRRRGYYDEFPSLFDFNPGELFMRPSSMIRRMWDDIDRMFAPITPRGWEGSRGGSWWPAVEVSQQGGQLNICAEVPGLKPEDIKVEVSENDLILRGERKQEQKQEERGMYRSERSYGQFFRRIPLPEGANPEGAKANFTNGELRISIPVAEPERHSREIKIETNPGKK